MFKVKTVFLTLESLHITGKVTSVRYDVCFFLVQPTEIFWKPIFQQPPWIWWKSKLSVSSSLRDARNTNSQCYLHTYTCTIKKISGNKSIRWWIMPLWSTAPSLTPMFLLVLVLTSILWPHHRNYTIHRNQIPAM